MTIRSWQIEIGPFDWPPEENGRWLASKSVDGHLVGITRRSYATQAEAEAAFSVPDDYAEPLNKE